MTVVLDLISAGLYVAIALVCLFAITYWSVQGCRWLARGRRP